ncbi:pyridoxal phosphate-dependent aminotransferase [Arundinibacter roseus]|uniref:Histidinol-phosphate aminotransferase family protein n=1 Tax=Arundinibacter roseus TaxID=2070510 RepID=A0A4R4KDH4_9BACT|nr:histidinol-phosphate transaminase [Arundinibacter roseus]TDB65967.1 histidinol-phosphate aminotransferase family protein [Arundinibacter roseus]
MNQKLDRRSLLKSGLLTLGGLAVAPHLSAGAFSNVPLNIDRSNRIYRSPLLREHFLDEEPDFTKMIAKLNANENPYGPPAAAKKAVSDSVSGGNRYAWRELYDLVAKIAKKEGIAPDHIMMGPGSSDLLEKVAIVLFKDGGNVVSADPSYMSLMNVAKSVGATWKAVPCNDDWSHNLKAMEAAVDKDTKLVYICNPNNPVGMITPGKELLDFCSRVSEKVPIFIDEAYIELAVGADTESMVSLLQKKKNVIIARTFSKIMGMAGLRIGYIAALPAFLDQIQEITRGGMGIAYTSIAAASAAMDDTEFQDTTRKLNHEAKLYLYSNLDKMGYKYIPSYTNFVIFPITMAGKEFLGKMSSKGVMVRSFDISNKTWCRVSIGTMDEMKMFVGALQDLS